MKKTKKSNGYYPQKASQRIFVLFSTNSIDSNLTNRCISLLDHALILRQSLHLWQIDVKRQRLGPPIVDDRRHRHFHRPVVHYPHLPLLNSLLILSDGTNTTVSISNVFWKKPRNPTMRLMKPVFSSLVRSIWWVRERCNGDFLFRTSDAHSIWVIGSWLSRVLENSTFSLDYMFSKLQRQSTIRQRIVGWIVITGNASDQQWWRGSNGANQGRGSSTFLSFFLCFPMESLTVWSRS